MTAQQEGERREYIHVETYAKQSEVRVSEQHTVMLPIPPIRERLPIARPSTCSQLFMHGRHGRERRSIECAYRPQAQPNEHRFTCCFGAHVCPQVLGKDLWSSPRE